MAEKSKDVGTEGFMNYYFPTAPSRYAVKNYNPSCETYLGLNSYWSAEEVFCGTYNEYCRFGMNCNYCKEERKR